MERLLRPRRPRRFLRIPFFQTHALVYFVVSSLPATKITVARAAAKGGVTLSQLEVPAGSTVAQAASIAGIAVEKVDAWAVFARKVSPETELHEGDRLDVGTTLLVDPMDRAPAARAAQGATPPLPRPRHGGIHQLIKPLEV